MKKFIKDNWLFLLIVLIGGLVGGYFISLYMFNTLPLEALRQAEEQNITKELYATVGAIQYGLIYGLLFAVIGGTAATKVDLWKKFKFDKKALITTGIITVIMALILFPGDKIIFAPLNEWVKVSYAAKPTISKIIGGLLAGGIIEEVMMRLFCMTLLIYFISKIFYNKKEIPTKVYVIANIISAILFAVGHIPSTMNMTTLTTVLIIRCMLLNGGFGLCFGYLYRKYGIGYAMISHGFAHLISDILMLIFI